MNTKNVISPFVAAIDIGTTKIVALLGEKKENGKIIIRGMSTTPSRGVRRGEVKNIEEAVYSIQTAVEALQLKTGVALSDVFVGIAGETIRGVRNNTHINRDYPEKLITTDEVNRLVNEMYKMNVETGEEILHVLPQTFIVDNEFGIRKPAGMIGRRLEGNFHVVVGEVASARIIERCVNSVGLRVNSLVLEPLASARAVLTDEEKEIGVALVDIGGGTTDIAVYHDNVIQHTAVCPFGGFVISEDIRKFLNILPQQAEELKIRYGSAFGDTAPLDNVPVPALSGREPKYVTRKQLAHVIQARVSEIFDAVIFELENSNYYDKLGAGIVLTGGGAMLKDLPQLVNFKTGLDVKIGFPGESLAAEMDNNINHPMYSTAVGLIIEGYHMNNTMRQRQADEGKERTVRGGFFDMIRNQVSKTTSKLFEENDAEMK